MTYEETYQKIKKLTKKQREAFDFIMINEDKGINLKIANALIKKGLITSWQENHFDSFGKFTITRYGYELLTHYVWCNICCEENPYEDEDATL